MEPGVLFVSPNNRHADDLSRMLGSLDMSIEHVNDVEQARFKLKHNRFDVILTEAKLDDGSWLDILNLSRQTSPSTEVIVTHPFADAHFWAEALNMGAYDLLAQPFYRSEVRRILSNACSRP